MAVLCLTVGALALSGCSSARRTFGLERTPPDEFSVVSRAPLSLPPEFSLQPPRPGAARPQEVAATQQAAATVFGTKAPARASGAGSSGETDLLSRAGAPAADGDIRTKIDRESTSLAVADKRWIDSLLFWQKPEPAGAIVDARKESQRLRENAAVGKPVTEGTTPVIERRRKAPLEGLFN